MHTPLAAVSIFNKFLNLKNFTPPIEGACRSLYHYYDPVHAYFLVYGILHNKFSEKIKIDPSYEEFDKLNQRVITRKDLEVTAISSVNLWRVADSYY